MRRACNTFTQITCNSLICNQIKMRISADKGYLSVSRCVLIRHNKRNIGGADLTCSDIKQLSKLDSGMKIALKAA